MKYIRYSITALFLVLLLVGCGVKEGINVNDEIIQSEEEVVFDESSVYGRALSYLKYFPMSQLELEQQLSYDDFTEQEIKSLFEHELKDMDWNGQAKLAAESFLESMEFTSDELRDQLIYNGFTEGQADYAIIACKDKFKKNINSILD